MNIAPTLLGTGGHDAGANGGQSYSGYRYSNVCLGRSAMFGTNGFTDETFVQQTIHVPGTISYLSWGLDTAFGAALTLTLKKNSSNTALAVSVGGSTTGWVTDSTDHVTVADGNTLDFVAYAGNVSYAGAFNCVSARFDSTDTGTPSAQLIGSVGPQNLHKNTTVPVSFLGILPDVAQGIPLESTEQIYALLGGTWKYMACNIQNPTSGSITIKNRKYHNGVTNDGHMTITFGSNVSGYKEDAMPMDYDTIGVGDRMNYQFSGASNSNTFEVEWIGAHFEATNSALCMIGGSAAGTLTLSAEQTFYSSLFGGGEANTTIPRATGLLPYALTAAKFTNHLTAADPDCTATFTLLKNGSASALAVSSSPGATGYFTDNTDTVAFAVGDTCANRIAVLSSVAGESVTWASAALLLQAN